MGYLLVVGSVRYIKLTHVGFRAHVKIASRIVSYRTNRQHGIRLKRCDSVEVGEPSDPGLREEDQHEGRQLCADGELGGRAEGNETVRSARRRTVSAGRSVRGTQRQGRCQEPRRARQNCNIIVVIVILAVCVCVVSVLPVWRNKE